MYWNGDWSWAAWAGMVLMMVVFWGGLAVAAVFALEKPSGFPHRVSRVPPGGSPGQR